MKPPKLTFGEELLASLKEALKFVETGDIGEGTLHTYKVVCKGDRETIEHFKNGIKDPVTRIRRVKPLHT